MAVNGYADREQVRELADRLSVMLPSVKQVGKVGALALAQTAVSLGLNPLVGELWAIPSGDNFTIMAGIKGLRRAARIQAERDHGMYTVFFRVPRAEEIDGLTVNAGDVVRACDVTVSGDRARMFLEQVGKVPVFTGIGIYRNGEKSRMSPLACARKRAESDALKQAFDLPLAFSDRDEETVPASTIVEVLEPVPACVAEPAITAEQAALELYS
jgi:hypothetical protein